MPPEVQSSPDNDQSGQIIRGYELRQQIGTGGFGAVYRAYQPAVRREVAIKVILPEFADQPDFVRSFESEAQIIARLEHPSIVPLYDYWREPGGAYLIMRYLRAGSLRMMLSRQRLALDSVARVLDQVAAALGVAHRSGVVHRDIKPDNILLDDEGNAYLADFGIAAVVERVTRPEEAEAPLRAPGDDHSMVGSPAYVAPEQIRGAKITPQTDIYSLGIVLFEMLCGTRPFHAQGATALLLQHLEEPTPSLPDPRLAEVLNPVLQRATRKVPHERYPDTRALAADFRRAVSQVLSETSGAAVTGTIPDPTRASLPTGPAGERTTVVQMPDQGTVRLSDTETVGDATLVLHDPGGAAQSFNPFKGLRAFQESDAADFFGREALVAVILARLAEVDAVPGGRFLALIGASGAGKSSVARAGLIPALRRDVLAGSARWFFTEMIPGESPFTQLTEAISKIALRELPAVDFVTEVDPLGALVEAALPADDPDAAVFLLIDQFEELFSAPSEAERARFLNVLTRAMNAPGGRLQVLITLRADFYDRPLQYAGFGDLLKRRTEVVLPLNADELRIAITAPAARANLRLEAGLVETMLDEVRDQPGALPLAQYALTELYERRAGDLLTIAAYREIGGAAGALAQRAEALFAALDVGGQGGAAQIFLRLVTLGEGSEDTRRRAPRAELLALQGESDGPGWADAVLDLYGKYRLLSFDRDPLTRAPTVEVAHEALIRTWGRLREWLDANRDSLRARAKLSAAAREWEESKRAPGFLATGERLAQFESWLRHSGLALTPDERAFLDASARALADQRAHDAQIARRVLNFQRASAILGVFVILASIAAVIALGVAGGARAQVEIAGQTLTPVPATLTPVQVTLAAARAAVEAQQGTATAVAKDVLAQQALIEALRYAEAANSVLRREDGGNPELAALLGIRALKAAYAPEADAALVRAADRLFTRRVLASHSDVINGAAFTPDGSAIVTAGADGLLIVWEATTGVRRLVIEAPGGAIWCTAVSPDGNTFVTGGEDGILRLWDAQTGELRKEVPAHDGLIFRVAFSPDGKRLLTAGGDGLARVLDAQSGAEIAYFTHEGGVLAAVFSPDGTQALSGDVDGALVLWNAESGEVVRRWALPELVGDVDFDPNGKRLIAAQGQNVVLIDLATDTQTTLGSHRDIINGVRFSPNGKFFLTASADGTAMLWDARNGALIRTLSGHEGGVFGGVFAPDSVSALTFSEDYTARLWDTANSTGFLPIPPNIGQINAARYGPDGQNLFLGGDDGLLRYDLATNAVAVTYLRQEADTGVTALAAAPYGSVIMMGESKGYLTRYGLYTAAPTWRVAHAENVPLLSIAFAPEPPLWATGGQDNTVRLWDLATFTQIRALDGHSNWITAVAFTPDGRRLVSASLDGTARLWDVASGALLKTITVEGGPLWSAAVAPDGVTLATGSENGMIHLWNATTGDLVTTLTGHSLQVTALRFSPADTPLRLLSASADGTARLWEIPAGRLVRLYRGHTGAIWSADISPDGREVVTAGVDTTARRWEVDYRDFVARACRQVFRDFSDAERIEFRVPPGPTCP